MGKPSKEEKIAELFYNESSIQWHFEEIVRKVNMSRDKVNKWLHKFEKEEIILKIKNKGEMPYYVGNFENVAYKNKKKIYTLNKFYNSGLLNHLASLKGAKTVIIFGSFARSDWNSNSDIDIFVYGEDDDFEKGKYENRLNREIQMFTANKSKDLKKLDKGIIQNIIKGDLVKGDIDFFEVKVNA